MKLTTRQEKLINDMILEESRNAAKSRDSRYEILGRSEALEAVMEAGELDGDVISEDVQSNLDVEIKEVAQKAIKEFNKHAFKQLTESLVRADVGYNPRSEPLVYLIEEYDPEELEALKTEALDQISLALTEYVSKLATLAVNAKSSDNS